MADRYPHVFAPIQIGPVEVENRLYLPPHGLGLTVGGAKGTLVPAAEAAYYYRERVEGGVSLVYQSITTMPRQRMFCAVYEESIPHFKAVADTVHAAGGKIFGQLHYYWGHTVPWEPFGGMFPVLGTNQYQRFEKHDTVHKLTVGEIQNWIENHGRSARNLREAGYDGIQVHAAHGMLVEQFLSPYYNKRTDAYGGSLENRMRVLVEALETVRANLSPEMAVGIRFNCDEMLPQGYNQDDARLMLDKLIELDLLHYVDLDVSVEPQQAPLMTAPRWIEPLFSADFIANVGAVGKSRIVVMGVPGRVTSLQQAEDLLALGGVDMVGAARGLIAEPNLIRNAREGKEHLSRTCIACNFCISGGQLSTGWGCVINPATGRERLWGTRQFVLPEGHRKSKVVVVGAGPAGMEAARVTGLLGHQVVLFERSHEVGGQLALWGSLPEKELLLGSRDWYRRQLDEAQVDLRPSTTATAESVLAERPDAVIVATGARFVRDGWSGFMPEPIAGADHDFVYTPEDIIEGGVRPSGRVLILDEEQMYTGLGLAQLLAESGAQVEVVTREMSPVGVHVWYSLEFPYLLPKLQQLGVTFLTGHYIKSIEPGRVTVFDFLSNLEQTRPADAVVLATMRRQASTLDADLEGKVPQLFVVGDALAPRALFDATYEGHRFARLVGDPEAPRNMAEALFSPSPDSMFPAPAATLLETNVRT